MNASRSSTIRSLRRSDRCLAEPLGHRGLTAAASAAGIAASYYTARQRPLPAAELDLTETINSVPDALATALWPVMQLGNVFGPVIVAGAMAIQLRQWQWPVATAAVGAVTWLTAKFVKDTVERGRPAAYLPGIDVREGDGGGFGYLSGHSAVAAAAAVMVMSILPPRWRAVPIVVAWLVGIARIVYGVHLPADVVGGWGFGVLWGLLALWLTEMLTGRAKSFSRVRGARQR